MEPQISGYCFPNDIHILWSIMIVMYPYITGLVAGSFVVSSLYHVFGRQELKPISRLSLVGSLCFLLFATLPLLVHLGRPERALNIMITPNFSSAMAAFGILYSLYLILVVLETWLVYRKDIILLAQRSTGLRKRLYSLLALGVYDTSEESLKLDHSVVVVLAAIGIPLACLLHGYVGFMFGSVKANTFWSTPLMPIIFLCSAITSGIAMVMVLYQCMAKLSGTAIQPDCVQALARWLWGFMLITVSVEMLEIMCLSYEQSEHWMVVGPLLSGKLAFSFIVVQMVFGSLIPAILLGVVVLMKPYLTNPLRNTISFVAALILLIQVLAMRWNVVIGGQLSSKSMMGFRQNYDPGLFEKEGYVVALGIFLLPFICIVIFHKLLPVTVDGESAAGDVTEEQKAGTQSVASA